MLLKKSPNSSGPVLRRIGVTGGIGSGKSHVCRLIEKAGFPVFYCDDEAKSIIRTDPEVCQALRRLVGEEVYAADGTLVKPVLARYICQGKEAAKQVDAVVHPRVRDAFLRWCAAREGRLVFMECALLFEAGFDCFVDAVALVSAPQELRVRRVMERDGVSREKVQEWMALQMSEEEKARRSDFIIENNGGSSLQEQLKSLFGFKIF
ncbi:MAG TPA: dephospho-CoA kinase [Alloprevotella sp.]|nr:dephospho-CoA kinase [Alloprevotella sp.]